MLDSKKHKRLMKKERFLLQFITLRWEKEVRGAPYAAVRNQMEKALSLPENLFSYDTDYGQPYHKVVMLHNKKGLETVQDQVVRLNPGADKWKLGCIEIDKKGSESEYDVTFTYSQECGKPARYDSKNHALTERAFGLTSNEYGRVLYNGRHLYSDTGEWYYELNILNMLLTKQSCSKIFIDHELVKEYKQIAILY
ncbi:hypothetical protein GCM10008014_34830 [Paenibacillus silvae]|uniref:Uncharacterized protein n=1 Tax=Paenibacillus silvae TaxID=1325358 RepID=A0ABQ1ZGH4_9BACL|nr:hypothetical protein [Paenibacillus silvae]GGH60361.1 hypothetical protein GCM10008014_34830 [Paenibacillus silvae]